MHPSDFPVLQNVFQNSEIGTLNKKMKCSQCNWTNPRISFFEEYAPLSSGRLVSEKDLFSLKQLDASGGPSKHYSYVKKADGEYEDWLENYDEVNEGGTTSLSNEDIRYQISGELENIENDEGENLFEVGMANAERELLLDFYNVNANSNSEIDHEYAENIYKAFQEKYSDARAKYAFGWLYFTGQGVSQNDAEAIRWFSMAAEQGDASAENSLGQMYAQGRGVPQNNVEAIKWFRMAADQGHANAQFNLGAIYYIGNGVTEDYKTAQKWFALAAEQGETNALMGLAGMYENGLGVDQDYEKAFKLYKLSAEQGNEYGQAFLGEMYYDGNGVERDYSKAIKWFMLSAEQKNNVAQFYLGKAYHEGNGVNLDLENAIKWLELAAGQDNEEAQEYLNELHSTTT